MSAPVLELAVEDPAWEEALPAAKAVCARAAAKAFEVAGVDPAGRAVSVLLTDDEGITRLNGLHRGRIAATNVLSWPAEDLRPDAPGDRPRAPAPARGPEAEEVGDLALALGVCAAEAAAAGLPLGHHVTHLVLHGVLHCLGHDHEEVEDADLMEGLERRALSEMGLHDPYAAPYLHDSEGAAPPDATDGAHAR